MSLIADALKAAQSARSQQASRVTRTRRLMSTPIRHRRLPSASSWNPRDWPRPVAVAGGAFGAALCIAVGVVALSPGAQALPGAETGSAYAFVPAGGEADSPASVLATGHPSVPAAAVEEEGDGEKEEEAGSTSTPPTAAHETGNQGTDTGRSTSDADAVPAPSGNGSRASAPPGAPDVPTLAVPDETQPGEPSARASGSGLELRIGGHRNGTTLFHEAVAAQRGGRLAEAAQLYQRALAMDGANAELHNNLGTTYQSMGELALARDAFRRALDIDSRYAAAWSNLGAVLGALGKGSEARAALNEAIRLDASNVGARVNMAIQYRASGMSDQAVRLLREALTENPGMPEAHYALAQVLEDQGDRAGAVRHYTLFLTTGSGSFPDLEPRVRERLERLGADDA